MCPKRKLDHFLTLYTKINSKWITYLKVRSETIKFQKENIGSKFFDTAHGNIFWDVSLDKDKKTKINIWDYIKLKSFCIAKETINKTDNW